MVNCTAQLKIEAGTCFREMLTSQKSSVVQGVAVYVGSACLARWMWKVPAERWMNIQMSAVIAH